MAHGHSQNPAAIDGSSAVPLYVNAKARAVLDVPSLDALGHEKVIEFHHHTRDIRLIIKSIQPPGRQEPTPRRFSNHFFWRIFHIDGIFTNKWPLRSSHNTIRLLLAWSWIQPISLGFYRSALFKTLTTSQQSLQKVWVFNYGPRSWSTSFRVRSHKLPHLNSSIDSSLPSIAA